MARPDAAHTASPTELQERLALEREGIPFLLYRHQEGQQIAVLDPALERVTVGRGDEVDIKLAGDEQISTLHAELERIGGQWTIADDGLSRNGTFVNGERIASRRRLRDGDEVRFGETLAIFREPAAVRAGETVTSPDAPPIEGVTEIQRKILIALCRPFRDGSPYATPATNQQIADEVFLSVDAVKGHLRTLFDRFDVGDLPQNQKRARLAELALKGGLISIRDM
jgi:hypothetical protein